MVPNHIFYKVLIPAASACIGLASIGSQTFWMSNLANAQSVTNRKVQGFPWKEETSWVFSQDLHGSINNGLDFATPDGAAGDVYSVDSGTVYWYDDCTIIIKRADGLYHGYHHVKPDSNVAEGQPVSYQTKLGTTSICGGSRGHHVHFWLHDESTSAIQKSDLNTKTRKDFNLDGFHFGDWQLRKERDFHESNGNGYDYVFKKGKTVACAGSTIQEDGNICTTNWLRNSNSIAKTFQQPWSKLTVSPASVDLTVEADNLSNSTVYWTLYRDSVGNLPPRLWRGQQLAPGNSITLRDLDGPGDSLKGVDYYTIASLNPISDLDARKMRTSCFKSSGGLQLCDRASR